jgi:hypothetical protein
MEVFDGMNGFQRCGILEPDYLRPCQQEREKCCYATHMLGRHMHTKGLADEGIDLGASSVRQEPAVCILFQLVFSPDH